jgi:hypothetical protein
MESSWTNFKDDIGSGGLLGDGMIEENKENDYANKKNSSSIYGSVNVSLVCSSLLGQITNQQQQTVWTKASNAIAGITSAAANDSFDGDKIKLDVYENAVQKLAAENKQLRKRVKKLTELARSKEEQLIEAFNEAVEDKRKNEEKSKQEHKFDLHFIFFFKYNLNNLTFNMVLFFLCFALRNIVFQ